MKNYCSNYKHYKQPSLPSDIDCQDLDGSDSEEDGVWDHAITVDNETAKSFKKLLAILDSFPPVQWK